MREHKYYLRHVVLMMIRFYQLALSPDHSWLSTYTMHGCKYRPTCSEYNYQAIEQYGIVRGVWLGSKRILRCNPLSHGGYDPVPLIKPKHS